MRRIDVGGAALLTLLAAACEPDQVLTVRPVLVVDDQAIDFGPVAEGETAILSFQLQNPVAVPVEGFEIELLDTSSADFSIATSSTAIGPGQILEVQVRFQPRGPGEDEGTIEVRSEYLEGGEAQVSLHGGPIQPCIEVEPDPIDFGPAQSATVTQTFEVYNRCQADLHISSIGTAADGNPDFVLRPWETPVTLPPGTQRSGAVDYVRSGRATAGRLVIESDAPDMSPLEVRLLPDPYRACEDGEDNDGDGLTDFPDDPGCAAPEDDDESNPPECEDGTTEVCGSDEGECAFGLRTCRNRIWGPCEGDIRPTPELCDGLDNDCDTRVDEEVTGTCTVNECAGARQCVEASGVSGGQWGACIPIAPEPEICDGADNDCNGQVDDGIVEACMVFMCTGTRICVPGGMGEFTACQVMPQSEICNGLDEDCNGVPDDGIPDLTCGVGVCTATAAACANGQPGVCVPGAPGTEVCNGLDDDCNGPADDLPDLSCGVGQCARTAPACVGGTDNACVPGPSANEVCNGLDDDCNGTPDDMPDISCGIGECLRVAPACVNNADNTCTPGTAGTEICNGLDDDCNGTPDDLADLSCGVGECARTVPACVGTAPNMCVPGTPVTEICNGLDDDCNGVADDNGACATPACGLSITTADPQEPNNTFSTANPQVLPVLGTRTFNYDITLTPGDEDWMQFNFPGPGAASLATLSASVTCVSWATATGCAGAPRVGLAAWYFDDFCSPAGQQDGYNDGSSGLAFVTSSGSVSPFGICTPQRFRLRAFPNASICAGEAINAEIQVTVSFQ